MSTIKSSAEDLTLNADGSGNDIKFQSNGVEKASLTDGGVFTATSFAGSGAALTGTGSPSITDNGNATAMTIDSSERIGIGTASPAKTLDVNSGSGANVARFTSTAAEASIQLVNDARTWSWGVRDISSNTNAAFIHDNGASADRLVISTAGVVSIPVGIELGSGVDGTAANTLDDYEEGTWTPALASTTTSCSMGTVHTSHYTKIGNVVKLYTSFEIDSSANPATGNLRFTGFPFALKTLGEGALPITIYYNYKAAPMAFMSKSGYTYYSNAVVDGNNLGPLVETIGQNTTNVMGMQFSYLTDA